MKELEQASIFISYRRKDTAYIAASIQERMKTKFGPDSVFMDVDNIPLGLDFRSIIDHEIAKCDVLLVIIGDNWRGEMENGESRIDDANDFVRLEIESALKRDIPIVPVLVGRAKMPIEKELPASLKEFAFRNAAFVRSGRDLHDHLNQLESGLDSLLKKIKPKEPAPEIVPEEKLAHSHIAKPESLQAPALETDPSLTSKSKPNQMPKTKQSNELQAHIRRVLVRSAIFNGVLAMALSSIFTVFFVPRSFDVFWLGTSGLFIGIMWGLIAFLSRIKLSKMLLITFASFVINYALVHLAWEAGILRMWQTTVVWTTFGVLWAVFLYLKRRK